ncbi:class I SAM-dependent methyltransferase [Microbacterium arabinogalactanolyticum]|uniref:class I SAM-dependent methyltransferase n=1 Tax=Microbacterium arabinogalactanolyticum TaxID=69365 RepID=UPI004045135F
MDEAVDLFSRTRAWFEEARQVDYYAAERSQGPTILEDALLNHLRPQNQDVLDLGCGAGRLAVPLALLGNRVRGVDISAPLVENARKFAMENGADGAVFDVVTSPELKLEPASFDLALSVKHFCYVPGRRLRRRMLRAVSRALRPQGRLLLVSHVVPSETEALEALREDTLHKAATDMFNRLDPLDTFSEGKGYVHWFTRESLLNELSEFGSVDYLVASADNLQLGMILAPHNKAGRETRG